MADISQKSPLDQHNKLQPSPGEDDDEHGVNPPQDQDLHVIQDPVQDQRSAAQQHQNPEYLKLDQAALCCTDHRQPRLCVNHIDQHHSVDLDPPEDQQQLQGVDQLPIEAHDEDQAWPQDVDKASSQDVDRASSQDVDRASSQDIDRAWSQDIDQASSQDVDRAWSQDIDQAWPQDVDKAWSQDVDRAWSQDVDRAWSQDVDRAWSQDIDQASSQDVDRAWSQDIDQASSQDVDRAWSQDIDQAWSQAVDQASSQDKDQASCQNVDQTSLQDVDHKTPSVQQTPANPDQDLTTSAACEDEAGESGGRVPALVITQAEGSRRPVLAQPVAPPATPAEPQKPERPADLVIPAAASIPTDPSPSSSDGGDMACSDLMSLKSDSISLASEAAGSRRSEEDTRSVAASSVMSLEHRVQMEPMEKDWLRSSVVGNMAAQRQLLAQEPGLAFKKTALHWAAKQGRLEAVDMMLRSGVDVNIRSGYTALHLASIHRHHHVVQALINTYNAKTNVRDYHGKMAVHYWSGSADIFTKPDCQPDGTLSRGRWIQRYALPSLLLSRSRSQSQLNLDFVAAPQSQSDLHM